VSASHCVDTTERQDAVKLLEALVRPCDAGTTDHAWRKCRRCMTVHLVENRDPVAMRLLNAALRVLATSTDEKGA
jgi:hypothetical protein